MSEANGTVPRAARGGTPECQDCGRPTSLAVVDWAEGAALFLCWGCIVARAPLAAGSSIIEGDG